MSNSLPPLVIPTPSRFSTSSPSNMAFQPISEWSDGYRTMSSFSSSPPRSSSPPMTPLSSRNSGSAYIYSSPVSDSKTISHPYNDAIHEFSTTWDRSQQLKHPNSHVTLPHFKSLFPDPSCTSTFLRRITPPPFVGKYESVPSHRPIHINDTQSRYRPVLCESEDEEDQDDNPEEHSFVEECSRVTFFRTSAERGQWRYEPPKVLSRSSNITGTRLSAPTFSPPPTQGVQIHPRPVSEPALSPVRENTPSHGATEPDSHADEHTREEKPFLEEGLENQKTNFISENVEPGLLDGKENESPEFEVEINGLNSPLPPSSPPLSSALSSPIMRSESPLSFAPSSPDIPPSSPLSFLDSDDVPSLSLGRDEVTSEAQLHTETLLPLPEREGSSQLPDHISSTMITPPTLTHPPTSRGSFSTSSPLVLPAKTLLNDEEPILEPAAPHSPPAVLTSIALTSSTLDFSVGDSKIVIAVDPAASGDGLGLETELEDSNPDTEVRHHVDKGKTHEGKAPRMKDENTAPELLTAGESRKRKKRHREEECLSRKRLRLESEGASDVGQAKAEKQTSTTRKYSKRCFDEDEDEDEENKPAAKQKKSKKVHPNSLSSNDPHPSSMISNHPATKKPKQVVTNVSPSSPLKAAPKDSNTQALHTEMRGMVIEGMATSRASCQTASSLYKCIMACHPAMKAQRSENEWMEVILCVLREGEAGRGSGVFGKVESSFKDELERPLEAQWFYVPEQDEDQDRASLIKSMMPRPGKRTETKKYKQYYYRPLAKISRWDPEDEM